MTNSETKFLKAFKELSKCHVEVVREIERGSDRYRIIFMRYKFFGLFKKDFTYNVDVLLDNIGSITVGTNEADQHLRKLKYPFSTQSDALKVVDIVMKYLYELTKPYFSEENGKIVSSQSVKEVIFLENL